MNYATSLDSGTDGMKGNYMLAQTLDSTGLVFSKTDKGREEMAKRTFGLNPLQRRVLILIDGSKDLETLADMIPAMVPAGQLREILVHLLEHGFIAPSDSDTASQTYPGIPAFSPQSYPDNVRREAATSAGAATPVAVPAGGGDSLTDDPAIVRQVKDFMTTTAQTYLGLLSAPVIQRIEQARTAAQLMTVAGHWNMALRDSQQGKRFAGPYLEQVKAALLAGTRPVLDDA
ncbi:hypothetical protein [Janthinobacterium sp. 17J80-10]|uniref:hypothetical protein n=1 Tax=Janthinobacterium sp. 17J80-10 TaxID=2497863 RepID=UPI00100588B8|nr:hypothetical protein [Janthinobacterium sp. 17J80-10]QAU35441.1 hypothetical protein EKL02_15380 [Janthinobacterium sp. 17J80-10]